MMKLGPYDLDTIITGDARELAKAIPDESVDLIFTDPVYQNIDDYRWLAETAARILKSGGEVLVYAPHYHLDKVIQVMTPAIDYRWALVEKNLEGRQLQRIWVYGLNSYYSLLLWYSKGELNKRQLKRRDYVLRLPSKSLGHKWAKGITGVQGWIGNFTLEQDIIVDFFSGSGTTAVVCKMLNRRYLAFEIDLQTAQDARHRVANTQPPLPGLVAVQENLTLPGGQ